MNSMNDEQTMVTNEERETKGKQVSERNKLKVQENKTGSP